MDRTEILKRLAQLERLAEELAAGLNIKKAACGCCGHEKFEDWGYGSARGNPGQLPDQTAGATAQAGRTTEEMTLKRKVRESNSRTGGCPVTGFQDQRD